MRKGVVIFLALFAVVFAGTVGSSGRAQAGSASLSEEFGAAAKENRVPKDLLLAVGYVNTRWEMPAPETTAYERGEVDARGSYGVMALIENPSRDTLSRAAKLTGHSRRELKNSREANVEGGAALLSKIQGANKPSNVNGWYEAVAEYGDGVLYANQVYETLRSGASARISTGERIKLVPHSEAKAQTLYSSQAAGEYTGSTWYGTNGRNYTPASRGAAQIDKIVVHVTQGSWAGAISWFQNPSAYVSAHYTIRSSDGVIGQSVRERDIAWHATNYNSTSIGIEHEGFVSDSRWFTDAMYRSSAKLSAYLSRKYGIPIDRQHIVGHYQVPGSTHTDPGPYWDWDRYMSYVKQYAGSAGENPTSNPAPATYSQIVDNTDSSRFVASSNWLYSDWNPQRYHWNYRPIEPKNVDDEAAYRFDIPRKGRYAVYAWWPSSSGYNASTPVGVGTSSGWKWLRVDQTRNGGRWNYLGTFHMKAGDRRKVKFSRQTTSSGYVIADAIRIIKK